VIPCPLFDFLLAHFGMIGVKYSMGGEFFHYRALLTAVKPLSIVVECNFERRMAGQGTNPNGAKGSSTMKVGSKEAIILSDRQFITTTVEAVPRTTIADALRSALLEAKSQGEMGEEEEATWLQVCTEKRSGEASEGSRTRWWSHRHPGGGSPFQKPTRATAKSSTAYSSTSTASSSLHEVGGLAHATETVVFVSFLNLELFPPPHAAALSSSSEPPAGPHLPHSSTFTTPSTSYGPLSSETLVSNGGGPLSSSPALKEIDVEHERVGDVLGRLRVFCDQTQRAWPLSQASRAETVTLTINAHYRSRLPSGSTAASEGESWRREE